MTLQAPPDTSLGGVTVTNDARGRNVVGRLVRAPEFGAAVAVVAIYVFFASTSVGNGFTSLAGTASWLNTASELGIIAVPVGLLMIAGDFDLSIGSMVGAGSITVGIVTGYYQGSLLVAVLLAAALGVVVGLGNGLLVTRTGLPSFIVTLGANLVVAGLALTVSRSLAGTTQVSAVTGGAMNEVFASKWHGFDVSIAWWLAILGVAAWTLAKTRFGNWIVATGGDVDRARRAGIMTSRIKITLFVCTSLAATLVGVIQAVEYSTGDATTGQGYVFQVPIVVVIGGVLLTGGYGTILGVVLGTAIYAIANAGLFYTGWNTDYAQVLIGALMIIAVLMSTVIRRATVLPARVQRSK